MRKRRKNDGLVDKSVTTISSDEETTDIEVTVVVPEKKSKIMPKTDPDIEVTGTALYEPLTIDMKELSSDQDFRIGFLVVSFFLDLFLDSI